MVHNCNYTVATLALTEGRQLTMKSYSAGWMWAGGTIGFPCVT